MQNSSKDMLKYCIIWMGNCCLKCCVYFNSKGNQNNILLVISVFRMLRMVKWIDRKKLKWKYFEVSSNIAQKKKFSINSTGASDRSFHPIFNKRFDHLETFLTICRPKKVLSAGSLYQPLVPSTLSKCPQKTSMLPQKYHVSVSHMLSKPVKCFMENEN